VTTPAPLSSSDRWLKARDFWDRFRRFGIRGFQGYATWLTRMSWWRFFLYSLLLIIITGILKELPPFSWQLAPVKVARPPGEVSPTPRKPRAIQGPTDSSPPPTPPIPPRPSGTSNCPGQFLITVGDSLLKIQIEEETKPESQEVQKALSEVQSALEQIQNTLEDVDIPPGLIRIETAPPDTDGPVIETIGDPLPNLALLLIFCSIPLKIAYQGRQRAEATAARAVQEAENEALRRQVTEARLAAMQAQVEPHFLFNTLGSIEHLIETDPSRAARMQRSLITFLREAMPTLRETQAPPVRDLGCELAIIVPYLELLKMRMEERLRTEIRVPQGLMSAEFPPMMLQSLVENAIRHGLEPRPEGGLVTVDAAVVDGRLTVSVSDTGVGFGNSHNSGSGVGLTNIRERLRLLYGDQARLRTASPASGGTLVTIEIPYRSRSTDRTSGAPHINPSPIHESRTA